MSPEYMLSGNPSHRSVCPGTVSHLLATTLCRTYVKRAIHASQRREGGNPANGLNPPPRCEPIRVQPAARIRTCSGGSPRPSSS
eukprot:184560-Prymnesium_polylepis.1